jgi:ribosomal protein S18 acetylase RimI-like enzyme
MSNVQIRCADPSDLKHISKLWMSMITELNVPLSDYDNALKTWLNHVSLLIAEDPCQVIVATYGSEIIGYAIIEFSNLIPMLRVFGYAALTDLYVKKDWRGKGVGVQLLKKAETIAISKGFSEIRLSVLSNNTDAIRFYKSNGYKIYGIIMHKKFKDHDL